MKHEDLIVYTIQIESKLHSLREHPYYEYSTTEGTRKSWDCSPPEGEGWEENTDYHGGFERFKYHEEAYWRRRKDGK